MEKAKKYFRSERKVCQERTTNSWSNELKFSKVDFS